MKLFAILLLTFTSLNLFAQGAQELAKQRAQQQRDLNNQQQGVTTARTSAPGATSGPGYTTSTLPSGPQSLSPAQQGLIDKLGQDFSAFKPATTATDKQKQTLQTDLTSLTKSATKPTKAQVTKLAQDLAAALSEKTLSTDSLALIAKNINIVMNCSLLTGVKAQGYADSAQAVLKNNGVSDVNSKAVGTDLKAIITQIQNNKPKLYQ